MNIIKINTVVLFGLLFALSPVALKAAGDDHAGHGAHEEEEGEHEEGVVGLTPLQIQSIDLKLTTLQMKNINSGLEVTGMLALDPQDNADVSPMMGGVVKTILVLEGDAVRKGQLLATLEHPDYVRIQQRYLDEIHTFDYLEKEYHRQKKLYAEKVGSGREFQKVKSEYKKSKSNLSALKIKLNMLGFDVAQLEKGKISSTMNIVSPMKGSVSLVETNIGAYAEPLSNLFEIVNNDNLHVDLKIYEKDIDKVKIGQMIYFTTSSYPDQEFSGTIYALSPAFEKSPKSVLAHAHMPKGNKGFIAGMFINATIVSGGGMSYVLPESAVVRDKGKAYIFVKKTAEHHGGHENHGDHEGHVDHAEKKQGHAEKGDDAHAHGKKDAHEEKHAHDTKEGKGGHDDHDDHDGHGDEKIKFKMVEVITGIKSKGNIEIKPITPIAATAEIAATAAYFLLAEMGKAETAHTH